MTETTHSGSTRVERMKRVQEAIDKTGMASALLWNPWKGLMENADDLDEIKTPAGGGQVPEIIPIGKTYQDYAHSAVSRTKVTVAAKVDVLTPQNFDQVVIKLKDRYVEVGRTNFADLKSANCTLFACCVIGMLATTPQLLGPGVRVELFSLVESTGGAGHAYVVVGRADCEVKDVDAYGADCFFIDVWYARHRCTTPGTFSVKPATPDGAGQFWDEFFLRECIKNETAKAKGVKITFVPKLSFTSDDLPTFGLGKY
ncbi:hypothetical protein [Nonomuraea basaltis]|uniref:hypothetical protein n=1 Tax=Nonomuraea basaltis TaxID=2495887 RepID=UPI00110C5276|nr:hypothetical protein [Nonomuraea basaltis]TMR90587.1 hypothetical protein EJK15_54580 [Nonomuraea basaltis]